MNIKENKRNTSQTLPEAMMKASLVFKLSKKVAPLGTIKQKKRNDQIPSLLIV